MRSLSRNLHADKIRVQQQIEILILFLRGARPKVFRIFARPDEPRFASLLVAPLILISREAKCQITNNNWHRK